MSKRIAPSILSANFARLGEDVRMIEEGGAGLVHVDVMDGQFVPNITFGPLVVKAIRPYTELPIDVHLMISTPSMYIEEFAKAGADYITVHVETDPHLHRLIQQVKSTGVKVGLSLNPGTPLSSIEEVLPDVDMVLIMSVNPGFGGQSFIGRSLDKVRRLRKMIDDQGLNVEIEIDGGVSKDNIREIAEAGVDIFVAGSAVFNNDDPKAVLAEMNSLLKF